MCRVTTFLGPKQNSCHTNKPYKDDLLTGPGTACDSLVAGYVIKWDEENTTSANLQETLAASTTSYQITDLTPQTTYVIQVWAETGVGPGPKTSTIISSGVTPGNNLPFVYE